MTHFPQPNPAQRARRARVPGAVEVALRSQGNQPVRALLQVLSATGGVLVLSKALEQGNVVEVAFRTSHGIIRGMAELLSPTFQSTSGCLQPFRFVALEDEHHTRLRMTVESLLDQTLIGSGPATGL